MLKSIYIKNINSIKETIFDFSKANYKYGEINILKDLVNPIAIYGHNGSGKTSFLNAIQQFINLITLPPTLLKPFIINQMLFENEIQNLIVKKDISNENFVGTIKFNFELDKIEYEYLLSTSIFNLITNEYLKKENKIIFKRNGKEYSYKEKTKKFKKGESLMVPALRIIAKEEVVDVDIQKTLDYFNSFAHIQLQNINKGGFVSSSLFDNKNVNDLLVDKSNEVKELLKEYKDFPIYEIKKINKIQPNNTTQQTQEYRIIIHGEDDFKIDLPFNLISTGMKNNSILLSLILSMPKNSVIFIDELEYALHPSALETFIKIVQRKQIQLVFSSHNTNILQYLRPDQIYFAKWNKGYSKLLRLSNIYPNIREVNNIEKMYLASVFDDAINNNE